MLNLTEMHVIARRSVKEHEGFRQMLYRCPSGKLTIGYGFNLESQNLPETVANLWLQNILDVGYDWLRRNGMIDHDHGPLRIAVLLEMWYQLGSSSFLSFELFMRDIKDKHYKGAAFNMVKSKWYMQTRKRCETLAFRMAAGVERFECSNGRHTELMELIRRVAADYHGLEFPTSDTPNPHTES